MHGPLGDQLISFLKKKASKSLSPVQVLNIAS
uniref:Uncharacterized protein n=1 Tax=Arundo donax TaxID=35708 RepID=A0A0A9EMK3_ARUDO